MAKNYFKAGGYCFFFYSNSPESAEDAYTLAKLTLQPVCIFQPTPFAGPWDRCDVVGHRSRKEILRDLARTVDADKEYWLEQELSAANARFEEVGRTAPMIPVAA